jgi:hypothetical protein
MISMILMTKINTNHQIQILNLKIIALITHHIKIEIDLKLPTICLANSVLKVKSKTY